MYQIKSEFVKSGARFPPRNCIANSPDDRLKHFLEEVRDFLPSLLGVVDGHLPCLLGSLTDALARILGRVVGQLKRLFGAIGSLYGDRLGAPIDPLNGSLRRFHAALANVVDLLSRVFTAF